MGSTASIAKQLDLPYQSGTRDGMQKMKSMRTAECVVGGFRYASKGKLVGSLLLGLYDDGGLLHHVGFTSNIPNDREAGAHEAAREARQGAGLHRPGARRAESLEHRALGEWEPLAPKLVVEVQYDHFSGGRFRHGTSFLRWRPDKAPRSAPSRRSSRKGAPR